LYSEQLKHEEKVGYIRTKKGYDFSLFSNVDVKGIVRVVFPYRDFEIACSLFGCPVGVDPI
jgi:hypothetical protein